MFDIKFLLKGRKLNKLKICTGLLYNFLIANKGNLAEKNDKGEFYTHNENKTSPIRDRERSEREKKYIVKEHET